METSLHHQRIRPLAKVSILRTAVYGNFSVNIFTSLLDSRQSGIAVNELNAQHTDVSAEFSLEGSLKLLECISDFFISVEGFQNSADFVVNK